MSLATFNKVAAGLICAVLVAPGAVTVIGAVLCFARLVTPEEAAPVISMVWSFYGVNI